jgi:small subunit ribosomal protein S13
LGHLHESTPQTATGLIIEYFIMRIAGITVPDEKRLEIALTAIYGVGRPRAQATLTELGIEHGKRAKDLSAKEETSLREAIEKFTVEGELRRTISSNIRRLRDIKSHRGTRHMKKLPVRGQGTKTNSRTVRGNVRKTMTSGRRKLEKT